MLSVRGGSPVDYRLCNQTVTVYHRDDADTYTRTVYTSAFFDWKKTENVDKTGSREASSFLLVIPCGAQCMFPGDKVMSGEGPECTTREDWAGLIPAKVPGLAVVSWADPKYWRGKMVHVEAGG